MPNRSPSHNIRQPRALWSYRYRESNVDIQYLLSIASAAGRTRCFFEEF